jgi:predicted amidohydrolase YtcJ
VVGDRPVWLERVDGHAGWANSAALKAAGITAATKAPDGGAIDRRPDGTPAGVLVDAAMGLLTRACPRRAPPIAMPPWPRRNRCCSSAA